MKKPFSSIKRNMLFIFFIKVLSHHTKLKLLKTIRKKSFQSRVSRFKTDQEKTLKAGENPLLCFLKKWKHQKYTKKTY